MMLLSYSLPRRNKGNGQALKDEAKSRRQSQDRDNKTKGVQRSLSHLPGYASEGGKGLELGATAAKAWP